MFDQPLAAGHHQRTQVVRRHPLASFFILAFGLSWGVGAMLKGTALIGKLPHISVPVR